MVEANAVKGGPASGGINNKSNTKTGAEGVDRFTKVVTDRPMYKVESCSAKPLVGHLIGLGAMPPAKVSAEEAAQGKTGAWNAYCFLTTESTLAVPTGAAAPIEVPAGAEVMIGESAQLVELRKYLYADKMLEIFVRPREKVAIGGGHSMRLYDVGCDFAHPIPRPARFALAAGGPPPTKQLTAAAAASAGIAGDEIPF